MSAHHHDGREVSPDSPDIFNSVFNSTFKSMLAITGIMVMAAVASGIASAQGLPTTLKGDAGLKSGSLPPPGLYITNLVYHYSCLLYTSDAADERSSVDLGG